MQTAEPLAKVLGIEIITDIRLKETDHGKFQNADNTLPEVTEGIAAFRKNISM
jgi:broad specificity phosphatase PhoE